MKLVSVLEAFCYYMTMDLNNPFATFTKTAFRLEALPVYVVDNEKEAFEEFISSGKLSENSSSDWSRTVEENVSAGKSMRRLRLISDELTLYEQYELLAYPGIKSGEEIRINSRSAHKGAYLYDFWFFDSEYITQMNYEADGTYINSDTRKANEKEKEMLYYWMSVFDSSGTLE